MNSDNRANLLVATQRRAEDTRERARAALRRLDREGVPVTFVTVAKAAAVSRALLYRDSELRAEIERLRTTDRNLTQRLPATQRSSDASRRQRLEDLHNEVRRLRADNQGLRARLATLLGEQRDATAPPRKRGRQTGPCN